MSCRRVEMPDGGTAIVCTGATRRKRCACGAVATLLCDGPGPLGDYDARTCDAPICEACALHFGPDEDLCKRCASRDRAADAIEAEMARAGMLDDKPPSGAPGVPRCACGALGVRRCVAVVAARDDHGMLTGGMATCGKRLCDSCAVPVGPGREQCPDHPRGG